MVTQQSPLLTQLFMSRYYSFRQLQQKLQTKKPVANEINTEIIPQSKLDEYQQQFQQNLNRYQTIIQEHRDSLNNIDASTVPKEQQQEVQQLLAKSQLSLDQLEDSAQSLRRQLDVLRSGTLEQFGDEPLAQQIIILKDQIECEQAEKDALRMKVSESYKQLKENQEQIHELEVLVRTQQAEIEELKIEQLKQTEEIQQQTNGNQNEIAKQEEELLILKARELQNKETVKNLEDQLKNKEEELTNLLTEINNLKQQMSGQEERINNVERLEHEILEYKVQLDEKTARILHLENARHSELASQQVEEEKTETQTVQVSGLQNYDIAFTVIHQEKEKTEQNNQNNEIKKLKELLRVQEQQLKEKDQIIETYKQQVQQVSVTNYATINQEKTQEKNHIPFVANEHEEVDINQLQQSEEHRGTYPHLPHFQSEIKQETTEVKVETIEPYKQIEVKQETVETKEEPQEVKKDFDYAQLQNRIQEANSQLSQQLSDKSNKYSTYLDRECELQKLLNINSEVSKQYDNILSNYLKFYLPYQKYNALEEQRRRNITQSVKDVTIQSQNNISSHTIDTTEYGEDFTKQDLRIKIFNLREKNGRHQPNSMLQTPQMTVDVKIQEPRDITEETAAQQVEG